MYGHMRHDGWMAGWAVLSGLFWLLLIAAAVVTAAWLARQARTVPPAAQLPPPQFHPAYPPPAQPPPAAGPDPERLLAERFARGEIDAGEYRERLAVLRGDRGDKED